MKYDSNLKRMNEQPLGEFKNYQIIRRVSISGMSEVYLAYKINSPSIKKTVAIKFLLPELNQDPELSNLFIQEAKLSSKLHHANIVQVFDFGKHNDQYFIVMEFIEGLNLKMLLNFIKRENAIFPVDLAVYIVRQIARALDYTHKLKSDDNQILILAHRDVSPQNILISKSGEVKLADFGIAKAAIQENRTQAGTVKGKLRYMSPEQSQGKFLDHRSDQYSLGVVFFELITGRSVSLIYESDKEKKSEAPRMSELRSGVSLKLDEIVGKMLAQDPEKRFENCGDVVTALDYEQNSVTDSVLEKKLEAYILNHIAFSQEKFSIAEVASPENSFSRIKNPKRPSTFLLYIFAAVCFFGMFTKFIHTKSQNLANRQDELPFQKVIPLRPPLQKQATPKKLAEVIQPPPPVKTLPAEGTTSMATRGCPSDMLFLSGGEFKFGYLKHDNDHNELTETLEKREKQSSFCMDKFEFPNSFGAKPVTNISWNEAKSSCSSEHKRLCSEKEWEYVCKGNPSQIFPYGETFKSESCNVATNKIAESGTYKNCKSSFGAFDLSGNVEEWIDEQGKFTKGSWVVKGGSARLPGWESRCSANREYKPSQIKDTLGFRCCADLILVGQR